MAAMPANEAVAAIAVSNEIVKFIMKLDPNQCLNDAIAMQQKLLVLLVEDQAMHGLGREQIQEINSGMER